MARKSVSVVLCAFFCVFGCQDGVTESDQADDEAHQPDDGEDIPNEGGTEGGDGGTGGVSDAPDAGAAGEGGATPVKEDAGTQTENPGQPDAQPLPAGKVGLFVAAGNGGRTITSCDDGRTWIAQEIVQNTNDDHAPYTHKGFAYGDGVFVHVSGWGTYARIKRSNNGVTWEKSELMGFSFGGVGFSMGTFVGMAHSDSRVSKDGGKTWQTGGRTMHGGHIRGGGGGGLAVAGGGSDLVPVSSWNQGKTFAKATGCPGMDYSNLGQRGGAAFGANALVLVSAKGGFCKLVDGKVVKSGAVGGAVAGKVVWVGDKFYAPSGNRAYVSADGESWQSVAFTPAGLNINIVARSSTGTYVGITQSDTGFFRSDDGIAWQKITGPTGPRLVDLAFGVVDASDKCAGKAN